MQVEYAVLQRLKRKRHAVPMRGRGPAGRQDEGVILAMRHFGGIEVLGEPRAMPVPQQEGAGQQDPERVEHLDVTWTDRVQRVPHILYMASQ
jgi:hypothetical protein